MEQLFNPCKSGAIPFLYICEQKSKLDKISNNNMTQIVSNKVRHNI